MHRRTFLAAVAGAIGSSAQLIRRDRSNAMPPFPIVDTHVHFWDPAVLRYPWLDNSELLNKPYLPADYIEAVAPVEVEKAVFVQAECLPGQAVTEVDWVSGLARENPWIQGIVASAPIELGDKAKPTLEFIAANPLVKGVRRMLSGESAEFMLEPRYVDGVRALGAAALTCDLGIHRGQLVAAAELARQCPDVRFMLCHIGVPDIKGGQLDPWREHIRTLAELPNVWCKLSGVATAADHANWTKEDLRPAIDHVLECFAFGRVAFGSDWPVMLLATDYPRWVETVAWALEGFSEDEQRQVFRETAAGFYRL